MRWDEDSLFQQFLTRDSALDGKFLTGVVTTGIYCLPSCPARRPRRENVRFFRTPLEAEESGLRPCLRCRPDHFYRGAEWHESLFEQTASRARREPGAVVDVAALARIAGLSRTALNALFRDHAQESPAAFLRRIRIEHACRLLRQGDKPAEAANAAGFASSSSFHKQFLAKTGMTPGAYAGLRATGTFTLRLPAGYRVRTVLDFYGRDRESVSESVSEGGLRKCFLAEGTPALLEIQFLGDAAVCHTDAADPFAAHAAAVRILGIDSDAPAFERQFGGDPLLGVAIGRQRGLRIPLTPDPWEAFAWAIIGQQISLQFAIALRRELIGAAGAPHPCGLRAHPSPEAVAQLDIDTLRSLKFSGAKAGYLSGAARAVANRELDFANLREMSARRAARLLGELRGIGPWTVQYVFLRGFGFGDSLPAGDAGLAQGLGRLSGERPAEPRIREIMTKYAPWRSLATCHVWATLGVKQT